MPNSERSAPGALPFVLRAAAIANFILIALIVLLPVLSILTFATEHDDAIVERAYLRDDGGQLNFDDVLAREFTPYSGQLTQGYQPDTAYWLRLTVRADDPTGAPWILRIRPNWHDDITLFDPADPRAAPRFTGDRHRWSEGETDSINQGFFLKRTAYSRDIYLRISSVHSYMVETQALAQGDARRADINMMTVYVIYMGVLASVIGWSFASFSKWPEKIVSAFGAYQLAQFLHYFFIVGLAGVVLDGVLPPLLIERLSTTMLMVTPALAMLFHIFLLEHHAAARGWLWLLKTIAVIPPLCVLLYFWGEPTRALALSTTAIAMFSVVALITVWVGVPIHKPEGGAALPRRWLRFFYVAITVIGMLASTALLVELKLRLISVDLYLLHSAVVTIAMGMFLVHRQQRILVSLATANQTASLERRARVSQNKFLSMLNHELKTPLSVLKLLFVRHPAQERGEATIDTMTRLIERCMLSDRVDNGLALKTTNFLPAALLQAELQKLPNPQRIDLDIQDMDPIQNDSDLFSVIVANLLDNALKYGAPGTPVKVSLMAMTRNGEPMSCLSVSNYIGRAGVPDMAHAFEKYYRADAARSVPGTGLGLYLVKALTDMMGGSICCEVDPSASQTISFTVCLPR